MSYFGNAVNHMDDYVLNYEPQNPNQASQVIAQIFIPFLSRLCSIVSLDALFGPLNLKNAEYTFPSPTGKLVFPGNFVWFAEK